MNSNHHRHRLTKPYWNHFVRTPALWIASIAIATTASWAMDIVQEKINMENSITQQLKGEISNLLPEDAFAVFTSVKLRVKRVKQIVEGERLSQAQLDGHGKQFQAPALPGFKKRTQAKNNGPDKQQQSREVYRFEEQTEIQKITVNLVLSEDLEPELASTAKDLVAQRMRSSFGNKATVRFQTAKMIRKSQPGTEASGSDQPNSLMDFLKKNWLPLLASLAIVMVLAALLKAILSRRSSRDLGDAHEPANGETTAIDPISSYQPAMSYFYDPEKAAGKNISMLPEGPGGYAPALTGPHPGNAQLPAPGLEILIESIVETISNGPLVARKFLGELDPRTKHILRSSFETSSLKSVIDRLLGSPPDEKSDEIRAFKDLEESERYNQTCVVLNRVINEFFQFKKLLQLQLAQRFGYMNLHTISEVVEIIT